jgi:ubiquinone/menaquinone biosynthesis C-methylase UbiE
MWFSVLQFQTKVMWWFFLTILGLRPKAAFYQKFYNLLYAKFARTPNMRLLFFNYGYAGFRLPPGSLNEYEARQPYQVTLYHELRATHLKIDLAGKRILEIGCGAGGGIAYLHRSCASSEAVGMDLSPLVIRENREFFRTAGGLSFIEGDAQNIPCESQSFDAVFNLESSHCYPDPKKFYKEVARILRAGGYFHYADFFPYHEIEDLEAHIRSLGLKLIEKETLNLGVLQSLQTDSLIKVDQLENYPLLPFIRRTINEFNGGVGSKMWKNFETKYLLYQRYVFRKIP